MGYRSKQRILQRENGQGKKKKKRKQKQSMSLVIRELKIKTTLRFHLTPIRMAKISKINAGPR